VAIIIMPGTAGHLDAAAAEHEVDTTPVLSGVQLEQRALAVAVRMIELWNALLCHRGNADLRREQIPDLVMPGAVAVGAARIAGQRSRQRAGRQIDAHARVCDRRVGLVADRALDGRALEFAWIEPPSVWIGASSGQRDLLRAAHRRGLAAVSAPPPDHDRGEQDDADRPYDPSSLHPGFP
jgi:hypothetical protein